MTASPSSATPPPGFVPVPGSRIGGWHRRVKGKYEYWYPPGVTPAVINPKDELDTLLRKELQGKVDLKGVNWNVLKQALAHGASLRDALTHLRAGGAYPTLSFVADGEGQLFDLAPNVTSANYKQRMTELGQAAWDKTPYGRNFESLDSSFHKYRVLAGTQDGTFRVMRADINTGKKDEADNVPPQLLQAMMSRWKAVGTKGSTSWASHHVDSPDVIWRGEERVFKEGAAAAMAAPLFERHDLTTAIGIAKALEAARKAAQAAGDTKAVKAIDVLTGSLKDYQAAYHELEGKLDEALDQAHKKKGGPLTLNEVYDAMSDAYAANKDLALKLNHAKLDWDKKWSLSSFSQGAKLLTPTTTIKPGDLVVDNQKFWADSKAEGKGEDGPLVRGPDGALYALGHDYGFSDLTPEYAAELAKAHGDLYTKWGKGTPFGQIPRSSISKAEAEVLDAIALLTLGNVVSVHYPDFAFLKTLANVPVSGVGGHWTVPTGVLQTHENAYKRASAVLTLLATRRPATVPLPSTLYRRVALTEDAFKGMHAGLVLDMNAGASSSSRELGNFGNTTHQRPVAVTYVVDNPTSGVRFDYLSGCPSESETALAGSFAISKIRRGGLNHSYADGDQPGRWYVHIRPLEPHELSDWGLKKGEREALGLAGDDLKAELMFADVIAHFDQQAVGARGLHERGGEVMKGSWATPAEAQIAAARASAVGLRIADPTERNVRPRDPLVVRRSFARWRALLDRPSAHAVRTAMGKGNEEGALALVEADLARAKPPAGFIPDRQRRNVWVELRGGVPVRYWMAGKIMRPEELMAELERARSAR